MRRLITLAAAAATLVLTACGGDDDDATATTATAAASATTAAAPEPTEATAATTAAPEATAATAATTAAPATTAAGDTTAATGGYVPGADPEADAAALAWTTAFDSLVPFDVKAPLIEDAEALRATIDGYAATGTQMGNITLVPTDVVVTGPVATITYDINFAGQPAYGGQTGVVTLTDGAWIVSRDQFCAFMALARSSCPA
jgi:hypothetical protein